MAAVLRRRLTGRPGGARLSLFWRVFATNAALLVAAAVVLGLSPITVSWPIAVTEVAVLVSGLAAMLAANAVLLRVALGPLRDLARRMDEVDLLDEEHRPAAAGHGEIAALVTAFDDMLARLAAERRDSARRALAAQEEERRRVAGELHDEVGQSMTGVLMLLEHLNDAVAAGRRDELARAREAVRTSLEEVRRIAQELRPEILEHLGLTSALAALARGFGERTGIEVDCRLSADLPELEPATEVAVYRIVQESLTNVARHADATRVRLTMTADRGLVLLRVVDNGRGFPDGPPDGAGLRGMRERAVLAGGDLVIGPDAGGGARVTLTLPGGGWAG